MARRRRRWRSLRWMVHFSLLPIGETEETWGEGERGRRTAGLAKKAGRLFGRVSPTDTGDRPSPAARFSSAICFRVCRGSLYICMLHLVLINQLFNQDPSRLTRRRPIGTGQRALGLAWALVLRSDQSAVCGVLLRRRPGRADMDAEGGARAVHLHIERARVRVAEAWARGNVT
jgi:hypothetical protein